MEKREIEPIAYIRSDFKEKFGIPRQSGLVESLEARIVFEPKYRNPDALRGIEGFSHLWILFDFSEAHRENWSPTVRPPRLGGNERIGVFASRSPFRPNSIGLSCVKFDRIEKTEHEGSVLVIKGADILDMTPIYDIKPYLSYADCHADASSGYVDTKEKRRLKIECPEEIAKKLPENKLEALLGCLREDPRPSYQDDENRVYNMRFAEYDISFKVCGEVAILTDIERVE